MAGSAHPPLKAPTGFRTGATGTAAAAASCLLKAEVCSWRKYRGASAEVGVVWRKARSAGENMREAILSFCEGRRRKDQAESKDREHVVKTNTG